MNRSTSHRRPRRARVRPRDEGHASVFLIMLVPVVMLVFALVWEAGQMLVAKSELLEVAHSAARVGTHQIDQAATLAQGVPVVDTQGARGAALEHLREVGVHGQAQVHQGRVIVLARTTYSPVLFPIGDRVIEAEASAAALAPASG